MTTDPRTDPPAHGTRARYYSPRYRCRCSECTAANTKYAREHRRRRVQAGGRYVKGYFYRWDQPTGTRPDDRQRGRAGSTGGRSPATGTGRTENTP